LILLLYLLFQAATSTPPVSRQSPAAPPAQPIPFSHKTHIAMKLKCKMCHANPDPGESMGIAEASVCMQCHSSIKADSPSIQKLAGYASQKREIPWVRVYQIPGYVDFSHKTHLDNGATCETCHGQVEQRDALFRETDISMGGCMECHRHNKAPIDCTACNEQRN
jgi:hypothetical protein